ncbi:MAG: TolC family protein, partial [Spirochaetia bacterium]|nr:TolC family protein [Spirochaetia bacterium]
KLDLTLSATLTGFDTNNENWPTAMGNAFSRTSNLSESNALNFFVGLKFETPLDIGAYKTVVEKRGFDYQKAVKSEQMIHEQLTLRIREHIRNLTYLKSVLDRTKDALGVSEQKVAELRRQFNNGKIDSTKFNIGYDGLRGIQKLYNSTLVQYEVEKCSLELTQGIFLKNRGIAEENVKAFMW